MGQALKKTVMLTGDEVEQLQLLGRRLRLARLRRNLSQSDMAQRAGITRKTYATLEAGNGGVGLGALTKALAILGYRDRMAGLLESDPIGEDFEDVYGRRRAGARADVADF